MHYLVRLIVEAENAEDANLEADRIMTDLVEWHEFDWYQTEADASRWEDCWKPCRLSSEKGLAMVNDAIAG